MMGSQYDLIEKYCKEIKELEEDLFKAKYDMESWKQVAEMYKRGYADMQILFTNVENFEKINFPKKKGEKWILK